MIVVVDIDGTIAKVGDRLKYLEQSPKDWDKFYESCFKDDPYNDMIRLVHRLNSSGYDIVFCTGRRESVRTVTRNWLRNFFAPSVSEGALFMRQNNDKRHDTIVKPELLLDGCCSVNNVEFILEDRNSMVKKWRELGYRCLQVQEGDF